MMKKLAIITEANEIVATGHLLECVALAHYLEAHQWTIIFYINKDMKEEIKSKIPCQYIEYSFGIERSIEIIAQDIQKEHAPIIVTNLRKISNKMISKLKETCRSKIICIDEFGHRELNANIIINPMIDSCFWEYFKSDAELFCGEKYLLLPRDVSKYGKKKKIILEDISIITVSMGGVDINGTTLKIAEYLGKKKNIFLNLVIGGAFPYKNELMEKVKGKKNIKLYENIDFLSRLFYESDVAFSAGGNTLHELACIGTPTLTIYTMPHERNNALEFEKRGFGCCLGGAEEVTEELINSKLFEWENSQIRREISNAGKRIIDAKGIQRVAQLIDRVDEENYCMVNLLD